MFESNEDHHYRGEEAQAVHLCHPLHLDVDIVRDLKVTGNVCLVSCTQAIIECSTEGKLAFDVLVNSDEPVIIECE